MRLPFFLKRRNIFKIVTVKDVEKQFKKQISFFIIGFISINSFVSYFAFKKMKNKTENERILNQMDRDSECENFFIHFQTLEKLSLVERFLLSPGIFFSEIFLENKGMCRK
jgi:hypothetical protein